LGVFPIKVFFYRFEFLLEKTQAQLDKEAVEAARATIEGSTFRIVQATTNKW